MLPREQPPRIDGRKLRAQKTRKSIVLAFLALIEDGIPEPTARQIADRASVAIRSIRQHFETRDELLLAVTEEYAVRLAAQRKELDKKASLEERIDAFVASRVRELETTIAIRVAAMHTEDRSEVVARSIRAIAKARRKETATLFEAEIENTPQADRRALIDAIDTATAGRTWDGMRRDAGLTVPQARAAMHALLTAALRNR
jgi:AcrR family transcriptional regulator